MSKFFQPFSGGWMGGTGGVGHLKRDGKEDRFLKMLNTNNEVSKPVSLELGKTGTLCLYLHSACVFFAVWFYSTTWQQWGGIQACVLECASRSSGTYWSLLTLWRSLSINFSTTESLPDLWWKKWRGTRLKLLAFAWKMWVCVMISGRQPASRVSVCGKNFNVAIFSDTMNMTNVKLCMIGMVIELNPFQPLSVTLIVFQGHSSVKEF